VSPITRTAAVTGCALGVSIAPPRKPCAGAQTRWEKRGAQGTNHPPVYSTMAKVQPY